MTLSFDDQNQILIEVIMDTPRSQSAVARSPETDAFRRKMRKQVREMEAEGIMATPAKE